MGQAIRERKAFRQKGKPMTQVNDPRQQRGYAEKYLMGSWLAGENREYIQHFTDNDFTEQAYLFKEIKRGKTQKDNLEISKSAGVSVAETTAMIQEYFSQPIRQDYFRSYAKLIITNNIMIDAYNNNITPEGISKHLDKIRNIDASETVKTENTKNWLSDYLTELDNRKEQKPLKYDIEGLNKKLGGLKRGELTTIAARPGIGKSTLALQTAVNIAKAGHKVLYFNLEMTMDQVVDRLILRATNVPYQNLHAGEITQQNATEITIALDELAKIESSISFKRLNRNIDYYKGIIEEEKPDIVIVDQLSHLTANHTLPSIREKYIYMIESLKNNIAIEYNIPVLLLAQLGRGAEERKIPIMADLKESGHIEETSDNVLLLYPDPDNPPLTEESNILPCIINIAKNRQGEQGTVKVDFRKNKCYFTEEVNDISQRRR